MGNKRNKGKTNVQRFGRPARKNSRKFKKRLKELWLAEKGTVLSRVMRNLLFCICENKGADSGYINSTMPLLPNSEILIFQSYFVVVQHSICW